MSNAIIILILLLIIGAAAGYVIKAKKSGRKCIGCPDGCCPSKAGHQSESSCGSCSCCCGNTENNDQ